MGDETGPVYPWYALAKASDCLEQGDMLDDCGLVIPRRMPSAKGETVETRVHFYDVVVLTQSCDLAQQKVDNVLVCPVWQLPDFEKRSRFFKTRHGKEELRRGNVHSYHLLNKSDIAGFERPFLVVDFRCTQSIPAPLIQELAVKKDRRLRLLPPYREHLSQAFARFFMRVGLPTDIPGFESSLRVKPREWKSGIFGVTPGAG